MVLFEMHMRQRGRPASFPTRSSGCWTKSARSCASNTPPSERKERTATGSSASFSFLGKASTRDGGRGGPEVLERFGGGAEGGLFDAESSFQRFAVSLSRGVSSSRIVA